MAVVEVADINEEAAEEGTTMVEEQEETTMEEAMEVVSKGTGTTITADSSIMGSGISLPWRAGR